MIDFLCIPQLFKIVPWKRRDIDVIDDKKKKTYIYVFWSSSATTSRFVTISMVLLNTFVFFNFCTGGGVTSPQILSLRMLFCH